MIICGSWCFLVFDDYWCIFVVHDGSWWFCLVFVFFCGSWLFLMFLLLFLKVVFSGYLSLSSVVLGVVCWFLVIIGVLWMVLLVLVFFCELRWFW